MELFDDLAVKILESSLGNREYGGMGSIIYFIEHKHKGHNVQMQVFGNAHVVTLEYQLYDHINYLLKIVCNDLENKQVEDECIEEFEGEWGEKIELYKYSPQYPLKHYVGILK